ncbi:MAG: hypothetical protein Pg6A_03880 [Termitinemataceae bacterium]|nr:MAG: hypothetical protein Pg6A_03880 [Termitinemataceae bacterium]
MNFKKHVITLSAVAGALLLIYILSFVFSGESRAKRGSISALADARALSNARYIEIRGGDGSEFTIENQNDSWVVKQNGKSYPAKNGRVEDLISALGKKAEYPVRSSSASNLEAFGLGDDRREVIIKDETRTIAELFFGAADATGKEIYIRSGQSGAIRSGDDVFSVYINGTAKDWYNLALFPDEKTKPAIFAVQRLTVVPPAPETGAREAPYTIIRDGDGWKFEGGGAVKKTEADSTLRYIFDAQAEDFLSEPGTDAFSEGGITIELGNGMRIIFSLGQKVDGRRGLKISNQEYIYLISDWAVGRIWRTKKELSE